MVTTVPASVRLSLSQIHTLCLQSLSHAGLRHDSSLALAKTITACERDSCKSHGLFRLPHWIRSLHLGKADGKSGPSVHDLSPSAVDVDAHLGFSPLALEKGLPILATKARKTGIAILTVRNVFNYSALYHECEQLANEGLVSMAFLTSKSFMAPAGGSHKLYGTNPMGFGFPRPSGTPPIVIDQASSMLARGEIALMLQKGQTLPKGCALDPDGYPTTDPAAALAGAQLPFGSYKGSCIALMVELLASGITGGPFSFQQRDTDVDETSTSPTCTAETVLAIDPVRLGAVRDIVDLHGHVDTLVQQLSEHPNARLPFSKRMAARAKSEKEGAEIPRHLYDEVTSLLPETYMDNFTLSYGLKS